MSEVEVILEWKCFDKYDVMGERWKVREVEGYFHPLSYNDNVFGKLIFSVRTRFMIKGEAGRGAERNGEIIA